MSAVQSADGEFLGQINTIQNANTKTLTGVINFEKFYRMLGLNKKKSAFDKILDKNSKDKKDSKKKPKKGVQMIGDILSSVKRLQANYSENNG